MTQQKFLETLFESSELVCVSEHPYGVFLSEQHAIKKGAVFFSINPMHTSRADANVTCYRNILLEIDSLPLDQQLAYIQYKVPVTSIVYSGGKSYHFIISLAEPCSTKDEYDLLVKRLHKLLPKVDPTTKNPSRFSRMPGTVRPDTGKLQELLFLGSRISRATLEALLPPADISKTYEQQATGFFSTLIADAMFYPDTVMQKVGIQGRNAFFFWLGQRLAEGNASPSQKAAIVEQAYSNLRNKTDFRLTEAAQAARVKE